MTLLKKRRRENTPVLKSNLSEIFDTEKFFGNNFEQRWPRLDNMWMSKMPAANITEDDDEFDIELAVPGMKKKDFHIEVDNGNLIISAEQKEEKTEKEDNYTRKEYSYGSFCRTFALPELVNEDEVKAEYRDGILKIAIPKMEGVEKPPVKEIAIS